MDQRIRRIRNPLILSMLFNYVQVGVFPESSWRRNLDRTVLPVGAPFCSFTTMPTKKPLPPTPVGEGNGTAAAFFAKKRNPSNHLLRGLSGPVSKFFLCFFIPYLWNNLNLVLLERFIHLELSYNSNQEWGAIPFLLETSFR